MNLYLDSGYLDWKKIYNLPYTFIFIVGGRGTGKTYGALKYSLENDIPIIYMRRQQTEADLVGNPEFSPFNPICKDNNWTVTTKPITKYNSMMTLVDSEGKEKKIGYTCALSTVKNIRGFDASDVELIIYDEFIPEPHARPIKKEHVAFLNAYETICRNRELIGKPPVKCLCLSNSNTIENELFKGLNLLEIAERMQKKRQEIYTNAERGLCLIILQDSPISRAKRQTAISKLAGDGEYAEMAYDNQFHELNDKKIRSRNLIEYNPVVSIAGVTFYRHKSEDKYYVSTHKKGAPKEYGDEESEIERFRINYGHYYHAYVARRFEFQNYKCLSIFLELLA